MKTMQRTILGGIVLALSLTSWVSAQVFDQLPDRSLVVIKFNRLGETSKKVSDYVQQIGLGAFVPPEMANPLTSMKKEAGLEKGIDESGDAAWVFIDKKLTGEPSDKSFVLLLPVTNYEEFASNYKDAKTDGAISEGADPKGQPIFFTKAGKYAVLSPSRTAVGLKPAGLKVAGATAKELQGKDAVVYVNFNALREEMQTGLAQGRQEMMREIDKGLEKSTNPDAAKNKPALQATANQIMNAIDAFVRDTDAVTFGVSLTTSGVSTTTMAEFKQGSYLGNIVNSTKNSGQPLVTGLPDQKYLVWGGLSVDAAALTKLADDFLQPILAEMAKTDESKVITNAVEAYRAMILASSGGSFGMVAPTGALGESSLVQGITLLRGDAAKIRASYKKMYEAQDAMMKAMNMPSMETTFKENAKTIDGVAFDQLEMKMGEPKSPEEQQIAQMMQFMYGRNGPTGLVGTIDNKTVLMAIGVDEALVGPAISAAKANTDPLSKLPHVQSVANELPKQRIGEVYVALDQWITTGLSYAAMFVPVQVQLPPNLPPIGATLATEGTAVRVDSHVSSTLVKALVNAGMQAFQQMQGGPGGGGGRPPMNPDGLE